MQGYNGFDEVGRVRLPNLIRYFTEEHRRRLLPDLQLGTITDGLVDAVLGIKPAVVLEYVTLRNGLSYAEAKTPEGVVYVGDKELFLGISCDRVHTGSTTESDFKLGE